MQLGQRSIPRARPRFAFLAAVALGLCVLALPATAGRETCLGERATIVGRGGAERLEGTRGDDVIDGREGADYILGRGGDDLICGGAGGDHLDAGGGRDRLSGERGDDSFVGGHGTQMMSGKGGNDTFFPSGGIGGRLIGGAGRDWLAFSDRDCARGVTVDLTDDRISYSACAGGWSRGRWTVRGIERVDGSRGGDLLVGSSRRNLLLGQDGKDVLRGRAGGDRLHGGDGRDRARGGPGVDRCLAVENRSSC
ncbi:MAG: hypothetical protein M3174_05355 [Actinomycetota bacterium]|nr:hypothetical protein [Actinomycetota bacterium]